MASTQSYHHGTLRTTLIETGLALLEEEGPDALTLRALAQRVGVSSAAPYRHFKSKFELMASLAAQGFAAFNRALQASDHDPTPAQPHPGQRTLERLCRAYVDFGTGSPALYSLMFSREGYTLQSPECQREGDRAFEFFGATVATAQCEGYRREADTRVLMLGLWASLHGWVDFINQSLVPDGIVPERWLDQHLALWDLC